MQNLSNGVSLLPDFCGHSKHLFPHNKLYKIMFATDGAHECEKFLSENCEVSVLLLQLYCLLKPKISVLEHVKNIRA